MVDITDPTNPIKSGQYQTPGLVKAVAAQGSYAYLAAGQQGLVVVDASDPTRPEAISFYDMPGYTLNVTISGHYLYVAAELAGLYMFDITIPNQPRLMGIFNPSGEVRDSIIHNNHAYVIGDGSLQIVDISNPKSPVRVSQYKPPGWVSRVKIIEQVAYVVAQEGGLRIVDVTNPANPVEIGVYETQADITDVAIISDGNFRYAYVSWSHCVGLSYCIPGMHLVDISNLRQPSEIESFYKQERYAPDLFVTEELSKAYMFGSDKILQFDTTHFITPTITTVNSGEYNRESNITGNYLYQPDIHAGLAIFEPEWIPALFPTPSLPQMTFVQSQAALTLTIENSRLTSQSSSQYPTRSFSPQEIVDLIWLRQLGMMDTVWQALDIPPVYLGNGPLYAERFDIDEINQGPNVVIKMITLDQHISFLFFSEIEEQWQLRGHITDSYSRFNEYEGRFIENGDDIWFVILRLSGTGTGFSLRQEDWYYLSDDGLKLVLSYPIAGHEYGTTEINMSFEKVAETVQTKPDFTVDIQIQCQLTSGYTLGEKLGGIPLFESVEEYHYRWSRDTQDFVAARDQPELFKDGIYRSVCQINDQLRVSFLERNFDVLMGLANSNNDLKRQWLKRFLAQIDEKAKNSVEAKTLLKIIE